MDRTEAFIEKYKELEEAVRTTYRLGNADSISRFLADKREFYKENNEIRYCQEVRNLIQHKYKIDSKYTVEPTEAMLEFMDALIDKVKNRPLCMSIAIPAQKIYSRTIYDTILDTMSVMREKTYTHVPIMEDGRIIGVFDENCLFTYLCDHEIVGIEEEDTFHGEIHNYLSLEQRDMEEFIFIRSDMYVDELVDIFEKAFDKGKRISVVFLTKNGRKEEKVLGLITPWDILGMEQ